MIKSQFISSVAKSVQKYAKIYNVSVCSPIIAQAIIESNWGKSKLSAAYHNYFGLKCGSCWSGKSVNMKTHEEYTKGTLSVISSNFRVYDNLDDGIKGYFEFIKYSRYNNLHNNSDYKAYCKNLKADGYATSFTYVNTLLKTIATYNLTQYDKEAVTMIQETISNDLTGEQIISAIAKEVLAGKYGNGTTRKQKLGKLYDIIQAEINK